MQNNNHGANPQVNEADFLPILNAIQSNQQGNPEFQVNLANMANYMNNNPIMYTSDIKQGTVNALGVVGLNQQNQSHLSNLLHLQQQNQGAGAGQGL